MAYAGNVQKLVKVVQELSTARTLEEVMNHVRMAARAISGADGATFVLKDQDYCFYADEDAIMPLWKGQRFPLTACVSGWSMINYSQAVIPDIYADPRIPIESYRQTFVHSLVMTPIRKDNPIGAIGTYWARKHTPTAEDLELLQALADAVSVSMENINLYGSLEQRIAELKQANQAKEEFLMTLSHELRTPLNAILGWAELLSESYSDDPEARLGLMTIQHSAKVQTRIIEDLLDMSYMTSGKLKIDYKTIDVVSIAKRVYARLEIQAIKKNIRFIFENHLVSAKILGDEARLEQILGNLLTNALKFSDEGSDVKVKIIRSGPHVQVDVADHGIGISKEFLPQVFEQFKQADSTLTRRFGGLGVGLSLARHLALAHRGEITAHSEGLGKGATFSLKIPLMETKVEETEETYSTLSMSAARASHDHELDEKKILVIDDDRDCRKLVETILKKNGASVQSASSVAEALELTCHNPFDAIVCDISMPEEDGFSFLEKIRRGTTSISSGVPVIALTAFADANTQRTALAKGFDNFVGKPFSSFHLVKAVSELTGPH